MLPEPVKVTIDRAGDHLRVAVAGELDLVTRPPLSAVLSLACWDGSSNVLVDFAGVSFCDAGTIDLLASTSTWLGASGRRLAICGARLQQAKLFRIVGLADLLADPSTE
jgi:anti-anti-sigma factor